MNHPDEFTIEMHVLRSEKVEETRGEIERHLVECHGCRDLAAQIERYYRDAGELLKEIGGERPGDERALVRSYGAVEPYFEPYSPPVPREPVSPGERVRVMIRRHPVAAGAGGFALAAALAAAFLLSSPGDGDMNPAFPHIDPTRGMLEIFNAGNTKIWELPGKNLYDASPEMLQNSYARISIADLEADGINEVVTVLDLGGQSGDFDPLSVYNGDGRLRFEKTFTNPLSFRGVRYAAELHARHVLVISSDGGPAKEILALADYGRSPNTLYRIDRSGNILGTYNHFGGGRFTTLELPGEGKQFVVFLGQNDVNEPDSLSYPVMIVLDPRKLTGDCEASDSRGFGLPLSSAEEYVIRLPLSDLNTELRSNGYAISGTVRSVDDEMIFEVNTRGSFTRKDIGLDLGPAFFFLFDRDFRVREVKYDSPTQVLRRMMVDEGRLEDIPLEEYLRRLQDGVRYWNGTAWQATPARVRPPIAAVPRTEN